MSFEEIRKMIAPTADTEEDRIDCRYGRRPHRLRIRKRPHRLQIRKMIAPIADTEEERIDCRYGRRPHRQQIPKLIAPIVNTGEHFFVVMDESYLQK